MSRAVTSFVRFRHLADDEIAWYLQTPEPYDKAGAYAVQGKGAFFIREIHGSYTNVMGLPLCEVMDALKTSAYRLFRGSERKRAMNESIGNRVDRVMERIGAAARRSGRRPDAIVSWPSPKPSKKTGSWRRCRRDSDHRRKLRPGGAPKDRSPRPVAQWHLIGHLQTNKARYAARLFDGVDTIDRIEAAEALDQRCSLERRILPVLIEVNTGGEATKRGVAPQDALALIRRIAPLEHLAVQGLMTMAPGSTTLDRPAPVLRP
jgi:hypothetical protein